MSDAFLGARKEYAQGGLDEADLRPDPVDQLRVWLAEASSAGLIEPNGMTISTCGEDGQPSARVVLLRGLGADGLQFFTNYDSAKGRQLAENPKAAASFWWAELERQVRIEGVVQRLEASASDKYFASRPYESQLASASSPQSQVVADRPSLESLRDQMRAEHPEAIPRPDHWGGYLLVPHRFEFWQGRPARFHDRLVYVLENGIWAIHRLAP